MATSMAVPITISEEAKTQIAEWEMQRQFEEMLDHTVRTVPDLRGIRVSLEYDPNGVEEPGVVIWSLRDNLASKEGPVDWNWGGWKVERFPPEVCMRFVMISLYGGPGSGW